MEPLGPVVNISQIQWAVLEVQQRSAGSDRVRIGLGVTADAFWTVAFEAAEEVHDAVLAEELG